MNKYLLNGVTVNIKLWTAQDIFSLMSDKDNYKIEILQCFLKVRSLTMKPALLIAPALLTDSVCKLGLVFT